MGNIHGRILAANTSADTLLLGSHMVISDLCLCNIYQLRLAGVFLITEMII